VCILLAVHAREAAYTLPLHDALPICAAELVNGHGLHIADDRQILLVAGGLAVHTNAVIEQTHAAHGNGQILEHIPEEILKIARQDRKSTRLNSSHVSISYAVFCLKKQ